MKGLANALLDLRVVIDWYPDLAEAHNLLGMGRVDGGGISSAIQAEQEAIRLNPRHEQYQLNMAKIFAEAKKFDAARALLEHLKLSGDPQVEAEARQQIKDLELTQKYGVSPEHERMQARAAAEEAARTARDTAENQRPVEAPPDKRPMLFAKGRIVSVDCSKDPAALVTFATGNRTLRLHSDDHSQGHRGGRRKVFLPLGRRACAGKLQSGRKIRRRRSDHNRGPVTITGLTWGQAPRLPRRAQLV